MKNMISSILCAFLISSTLSAEDGYQLWLRYEALDKAEERAMVAKLLQDVVVPGSEATMEVIREEVQRAGAGMLGAMPVMAAPGMAGKEVWEKASLLIATPETCPVLAGKDHASMWEDLGPEGYFIGHAGMGSKGPLIIAAPDQRGLLYGTFHLLRMLQQGALEGLPLRSEPALANRMLNHWDNLDRTVERGYAGFSIWDWHRLPDYIDPRYSDYARANASIGINATVLTNVNANALVLSPMYIEKVAALASVFRPYGIRVFLTARFSAPMEIGGLDSSDPLLPEVAAWWKAKAHEIYAQIPDFGGFLVKANSEGQPGPQNYGRSHADGANMLAEALAPHGGIVLWRAFVYSHDIEVDRAMQAHMEFAPLDGQFRDNVLIQTKNGAIDFQPREPFHPLFGALEQTHLALELQITQEYLGQANHLAYLAPLYKECLDADTYRPTAGTTVAGVIARDKEHAAMAGVSNIGTDRNWTGHPFGQANWYAFGRLAWDPSLSAEDMATEWISLTFGMEGEVLEKVRDMMMASRGAVVDYMTPLGLHHIMGWDHHYGPAPWIDQGRPDWTSVYYHKADSGGIGFDRTSMGSNALSQYAPEIQKLWSDPATIPEKYLLWFHHLPWDHPMASGNTLWQELCLRYDQGVKTARWMQSTWDDLQGELDQERFRAVQSLLAMQVKEAAWWRNACLLYFQEFSQRPFPPSIEQPQGSLEEYKMLHFPYAPGIKPKW